MTSKLNLKKYENSIPQKGQALVTLLVFVVVALIVTSAAVTVTLINSQTTQKYSSSEESFAVANAGVDNAILRLLRDPNYTGETLTVGNGTATITVTGSTTKTVVSEGVVDNFKRKIQAIGSFSGTVFTVSSWSEID